MIKGNPFSAVRRGGKWVLYGLFVLAIGVIASTLWLAILEDSNGSVLEGLGTVCLILFGIAGMIGVFVAIVFGVAWVAVGWRKLETWWDVRSRRKLMEAGTPLLDPRPLVVYGDNRAEYSPFYRGVCEFAPREFYEQNEEKYK